MFLQSMLIRFFLRPLAEGMAHVSPRARQRLFLAAGAGMFALYFLIGMGHAPSHYIFAFAIGCVCLGLMVLAMLPDQVSPQHFSRVLIIPWFGAGLMMLQAGLRINTDNLSDAIMYLAVFPVLWLIWDQGNVSQIFSMLCRLSRWSFVVFFFASLLCFPIIERQYPGMFENANGTGMYLALVLVCLFIELFQIWEFDRHALLRYVLTGLSSAMLFYTASRTGHLAMIFSFVCGSILHLFLHRASWKRVLCLHLLPVVFAVALFVPCTTYLFDAGSMIHRTVIEAVTPQEKSDNVPNSPVTEPLPPKEPIGNDGFIEIARDKTSLEGKTADQFSTGRLSIWKEFAKHVTLFGTEGEISYYVPSRYQNYGTSHNTPLEYAIYSGLVCGVLYLLFNIFAGIKSIQYAVSHRNEPFSIMPLMITLAFGVCSMVGSLKTPFYYMIGMYYFFVQTPLVFSSSGEEDTTK